MSLMALNAAWRVRGLEPIERILLLLLGDIADDQVHANPDISWLAATRPRSHPQRPWRRYATCRAWDYLPNSNAAATSCT